MTFENEVKNIKGRIREALYERKSVSIFFDFRSFYRFRTGEECTSTFYFLSYISVSRLFIYCRPSIPIPARAQTLSELRRCIQENGGNLL